MCKKRRKKIFCKERRSRQTLPASVARCQKTLTTVSMNFTKCNAKSLFIAPVSPSAFVWVMHHTTPSGNTVQGTRSCPAGKKKKKTFARTHTWMGRRVLEGKEESAGKAQILFFSEKAAKSGQGKKLQNLQKVETLGHTQTFIVWRRGGHTHPYTHTHTEMLTKQLVEDCPPPQKKITSDEAVSCFSAFLAAVYWQNHSEHNFLFLRLFATKYWQVSLWRHFLIRCIVRERQWLFYNEYWQTITLKPFCKSVLVYVCAWDDITFVTKHFWGTPFFCCTAFIVPPSHLGHDQLTKKKPIPNHAVFGNYPDKKDSIFFYLFLHNISKLLTGYPVAF